MHQSLVYIYMSLLIYFRYKVCLTDSIMRKRYDIKLYKERQYCILTSWHKLKQLDTQGV